jgi:hypothetical protein
MKPSRLLLMCFLATVCTASAAAQTTPTRQSAPTPPKTLVFTAPPLTTIPTLIAIAPEVQQSPLFVLKPNAPPTTVTLVNPPLHSNSCYTMRTYGAPNVEDLKPTSPIPPPTTCTDSAAAQMKSADVPSHH